MSHIFHPAISEAGLCDDCPDCQYKAINCLSLDADNTRMMWAGHLRSRLDDVAQNSMEKAVHQAQHVFQAFGLPTVGFDVLWALNDCVEAKP